MTVYMFPSPYGLIFILTKKATWGEITEELQVSVSLRSIIHSYPSFFQTTNVVNDLRYSFHLLMEYHSFL